MIAKNHYNSRFTNRYGEEWEFEYDPLKKEGVLHGSGGGAKRSEPTTPF